MHVCVSTTVPLILNGASAAPESEQVSPWASDSLSQSKRTVPCGGWGSGMCSALPQQCPQSVPVPPPHPPGGPGSFQDDGVSADAAGGLEGGGASGAASDCAASDCAASG